MPSSLPADGHRQRNDSYMPSGSGSSALLLAEESKSQRRLGELAAILSANAGLNITGLFLAPLCNLLS